MVVYGTEKVRQLCGYSTLAGAIKVRRKYVESKAYVWLKYGKSTVLYGNFFFGAYCSSVLCNRAYRTYNVP